MDSIQQIINTSRQFMQELTHSDNQRSKMRSHIIDAASQLKMLVLNEKIKLLEKHQHKFGNNNGNIEKVAFFRLIKSMENLEDSLSKGIIGLKENAIGADFEVNELFENMSGSTSDLVQIAEFNDELGLEEDLKELEYTPENMPKPGMTLQLAM